MMLKIYMSLGPSIGYVGDGGDVSLYISIAYYKQPKQKKRGGGVQIACKIAYVLNGKTLK